MTQNKKKKLTKNGKPLSRVSPVQYSPRRQSRSVLADYGGKDYFVVDLLGDLTGALHVL